MSESFQSISCFFPVLDPFMLGAGSVLQSLINSAVSAKVLLSFSSLENVVGQVMWTCDIKRSLDAWLFFLKSALLTYACACVYNSTNIPPIIPARGRSFAASLP